MEVSFRTKQLQQRYEDSSEAVRKWGQDVARKYVTRINQLYAVKDFQAAYNIRAMRLHPLKGSMRGDLAINLTGKWRLIVAKGDTDQHVIIRSVSNHYDD